jgi:hypothetical protein
MKRIIIALVVLLLIVMQFIPAKRTNPAVVYDFDGPAEVKAILKRSCYDCHSNETAWPWYSRVAPFSWFVVHHVDEGRAHLNFSNWEPLSTIPFVREEIHEETAEGKMPLKSYLLIHRKAGLSEADKAILRDWAGE